MYDVLIIGSGPAGVSAVLTAKARGIKYVWFGNSFLSHKIEKAEMVLNYPGLNQITGKKMQFEMKKQIQDLDIQLTEERIESIYKVGNSFFTSAKDVLFEGKSIILAVGMFPEKLIEGEQEYLGKGVSYCATCDGHLYRKKTIAVVCTSKDMMEEVEYLANSVGKMYLYTNFDISQSLPEHVLWKKELPNQINGRGQVSQIKSKEESHDVDGVFILREMVSPKILVDGLEFDREHIIVNRKQETNIEGCFAAGDCTGRPYQYTKAVGEGNVAIHSALSYLKEKEDEFKTK